MPLETCQTLEDFVAVTFEQQCGPAARAAGELAKGPGLSLHHGGKMLAGGLKGDFVPIVRWLKLMYAHSRTLMELSARGATAPTLELLRHSLFSPNADVVLWGARLLTRLATELSDLHPQPLADWFDAQGLSALVTAWRTHPDLHAIGALLPLVPPCVGSDRLAFFTSTLPAVVSETGSYIAFALETIPLFAAGGDGRHAPLCDRTILYLVQLGLAALREVGNHIYIYIYLSIYLSVCLSVYIYLSIYRSEYLSIYLSVCLSMSIYICIYVSIYVYVSIYLSIYLSMYICMYVYVYIYGYMDI